MWGQERRKKKYKRKAIFSFNFFFPSLPVTAATARLVCVCVCVYVRVLVENCRRRAFAWGGPPIAKGNATTDDNYSTAHNPDGTVDIHLIRQSWHSKDVPVDHLFDYTHPPSHLHRIRATALPTSRTSCPSINQPCYSSYHRIHFLQSGLSLWNATVIGLPLRSLRRTTNVGIVALIHTVVFGECSFDVRSYRSMYV